MGSEGGEGAERQLRWVGQRVRGWWSARRPLFVPLAYTRNVRGPKLTPEVT
jgi:hypothetical protein